MTVVDDVPFADIDMGSPDNVLSHLGVRVSTAQGPAVAEIDVRPDLLNIAGMVQGGVVTTLADVAGGLVAWRATGCPNVFTADMNVHFLAPGRLGPIRATATVLRQGRANVVSEVRVVDRGADDRLMAVATLTLVLAGDR